MSKQILMRAATDALGLDPECSSEELKKALAAAVEKTRLAEAEATQLQREVKIAKSALDRKTSECEQALASLHDAELRVNAGREANAATVKKMTAQLVERQKALKAINMALADTPENVVKKLKGLKKEKFDEATARKRAETDASALRKEKQNLQARLKEAESAAESGIELAAQHRDLHTLCTNLHGRLEPLQEAQDEAVTVPDLDEDLLGRIEKADDEEEEKS